MRLRFFTKAFAQICFANFSYTRTLSEILLRKFFMKLPAHLITSTTIATSLRFLTDINLGNLAVFTIWSGFLIDIDHPFLFMAKYKIYKVKKWIKIGNFLGKKQQAELYIFHSPEVNIMILLAGLFYPIFFWIFLGGMLHIFLDIIAHYFYHKNFLFLKKWSILYNLRRKNALRNTSDNT